MFLNAVHNLVFKNDSSRNELYHTPLDESAFASDGTVRLEALASGLKLDGYFNSFFGRFWLEHTDVKKITLRLRMSGSGVVQMHKRSANGRTVCLQEVKFDHRGEVRELAITEEITSSDKECRWYPVITASPESDVVIHAGAWCVDEDPKNHVMLNIVICTFRKWHYAEKNVQKLLHCDALGKEEWKILLVDNASEIAKDSFSSEKVSVIHQKNVGGAGGFARGMMESLDDGATHVLLMDDDADTDPESVFRVHRLCAYLNHDVCLGGAMFDMLRPNEMWESHAKITEEDVTTLESFSERMDMRLESNVDAQCKPVEQSQTAFCGWWFFLASVKTIRNCGLPVPIFFRGDDQEFGIRAKEHHVSTVPVPGIGTWHEPFYAKPNVWTEYFVSYNQLVLASLHPYWSMPQVVKGMKKRLLTAITRMDYGFAEMRLNAIENFLLGVEVFLGWDAEKRLADVVSAASAYRLKLLDNELPTPLHDYPHRLGLRCLLCSLLGGRTRPRLVRKVLGVLGMRKTRIVVPQKRFSWRHGLIADEVVVIPLQVGQCRLYSFDFDKESMLRERTGKILSSLEKNGAAIMNEFSSRKDVITSVEFWKKYLGLM